MSFYYSPEIVKLLMEDRVREARTLRNRCCEKVEPKEPTSFLRNFFRRETPATCAC